MELADYFNTVNKKKYVYGDTAGDMLGDLVVFYDKGKSAAQEDFDIAIIGIEEGVNSPCNQGCAKAPGAVREQLYRLRSFDDKLKIIDLGNIKGKTVKDKYIALKEVCSFLFENSVIPVIIGGSQEFTVYAGEALDAFVKEWRLTLIDSVIDIEPEQEDFTSRNFLGKLMAENINNLSELVLMGTQKYLYSQNRQNFIDDNYFRLLRLGEIRDDSKMKAEPYLRDSDFLSIDVTAVKNVDMPAQSGAMPNGLMSHEICQLAWYAGLSDRMKAFGIFELNPGFDDKFASGVSLGAQVIWYFFEGLTMRYKDYPARDIESYSIYIVHMEDYEMDIRFFNNPQNGRWWVEVPGECETSIVSCSKQDYEEALKNEMPENWIFSLKKSSSKSGTKNNNSTEID